MIPIGQKHGECRQKMAESAHTCTADRKAKHCSYEFCRKLIPAYLFIFQAGAAMAFSEAKSRLTDKTRQVMSGSRAQSSWWRFGSWMNFQCSCLAFSVSNFWRHSGHWKAPAMRTPTFATLPSPDCAAAEISMVSGIAA